MEDRKFNGNNRYIEGSMGILSAMGIKTTRKAPRKQVQDGRGIFTNETVERVLGEER